MSQQQNSNPEPYSEEALREVEEQTFRELDEIAKWHKANPGMTKPTEAGTTP